MPETVVSGPPGTAPTIGFTPSPLGPPPGPAFQAQIGAGLNLPPQSPSATAPVSWDQGAPPPVDYSGLPSMGAGLQTAPSPPPPAAPRPGDVAVPANPALAARVQKANA